MPNLYVFRHGEAAPGSPDFDRPLSDKGIADMEYLSKKLARWPMKKAMLVSSPSLRTKMTTEILLRNLRKFNLSFALEENGYLASDEVWFKFLEELSDEFESCIIVGHNPGVTDLVKRLTGSDISMPPGTGVMIDFELKAWAEVFDGTGDVFRVCTP
jgi:phosphohistidine phosphatase